jgi:hypothetical protein
VGVGIQMMKTKILLKDYINKNNTKFIISSHVSSYKYALPKLIDSLERNNIQIDNIISVVGGCENKFQKDNIIFTNHNSYDHTGIIEIIESNLESEYWFVLHDTCEAGPKFFNKLTKYKINKPYISLTEMAWMNMGLFSNQYIQNNKDYILSLKNCSKVRAILSERMYSRLDEYGWFGLQKEYQRIRDCKNIYNDEKKRDVLYFPFLDLYKFQSYDALKVMKPL